MWKKGKKQKPLSSFKNHKKIFDNLIKTTDIRTLYPIMSMLITYDSRYAITVTKKDDREYWIKIYDVLTYAKTFEEKIGGESDSYIKLKEVE